MSESHAAVALGFLTVVEDASTGYFGGYLLLSANGRPLEFHCTTPVKPNRAQRILYGPTLKPYLYGEQIGRTLISKSKAKPLAVCTDVAAVLAVREFVTVPLALIENQQATAVNNDSRQLRVDSGHSRLSGDFFQLGCNRLAVSDRYLDDRAEVVKRLAGVADDLDLREPFDRIRSAIEEAQRTGR